MRFWSASSNCADLFLIKAQKRRNTLCIPSIFNAEQGQISQFKPWFVLLFIAYEKDDIVAVQ